MRLVYFSSDSFYSGVLDSQVLAPLHLLSERMPDVQRAIVFLTSIRALRDQARLPREAEIRRALPAVAVHFKFRPVSYFPGWSHIWAG